MAFSVVVRACLRIRIISLKQEILFFTPKARIVFLLELPLIRLRFILNCGRSDRLSLGQDSCFKAQNFFEFPNVRQKLLHIVPDW